MVHKTAFLCSRNVPAAVVLKCFDWAIAQREAGRCVISGFHSRLEKDVLAYLLKPFPPRQRWRQKGRWYVLLVLKNKERGTDPTGGKEFVGTRWNNGCRTLAAQKAAIGALP